MLMPRCHYAYAITRFRCHLMPCCYIWLSLRWCHAGFHYFAAADLRRHLCLRHLIDYYALRYIRLRLRHYAVNTWCRDAIIFIWCFLLFTPAPLYLRWLRRFSLMPLLADADFLCFSYWCHFSLPFAYFHWCWCCHYAMITLWWCHAYLMPPLRDVMLLMLRAAFAIDAADYAIDWCFHCWCFSFRQLFLFFRFLLMLRQLLPPLFSPRLTLWWLLMLSMIRHWCHLPRWLPHYFHWLRCFEDFRRWLFIIIDADAIYFLMMIRCRFIISCFRRDYAFAPLIFSPLLAIILLMMPPDDYWLDADIDAILPWCHYAIRHLLRYWHYWCQLSPHLRHFRRRYFTIIISPVTDLLSDLLLYHRLHHYWLDWFIAIIYAAAIISLLMSFLPLPRWLLRWQLRRCRYLRIDGAMLADIFRWCHADYGAFHALAYAFAFIDDVATCADVYALFSLPPWIIDGRWCRYITPLLMPLLWYIIYIIILLLIALSVTISSFSLISRADDVDDDAMPLMPFLYWRYRYFSLYITAEVIRRWCFDARCFRYARCQNVCVSDWYAISHCYRLRH